MIGVCLKRPSGKNGIVQVQCLRIVKKMSEIDKCSKNFTKELIVSLTLYGIINLAIYRRKVSNHVRRCALDTLEAILTKNTKIEQVMSIDYQSFVR